MPDLPFAAGVVGVAYLVQGLTGFGSALIIVPLLTTQWPLPDVVVLALLVDLPASAFLAALNWRMAERQEVFRFLPGLGIGGAIGLWTQHALDARILLLVLGVYVTGAALREMHPRRTALTPPGAGWRGTASVAAGFIEVTLATCGPVVVAWLQRRLTDPRTIRATLPPLLVLCSLFSLAWLAAAGHCSRAAIWIRFSLLFPMAMIFTYAGHALVPRLRTEALRWCICAVLAASGLSLAIRSLRMVLFD